MKKKIYVMITLLCLLFTVGIVSEYSPTATVCAASKTSQKNKKAKKAFNKFLSKNKIAWPPSGNLHSKKDYSFRYMELGKKKVPVLIISCSKTAHIEQYVAVLQYINGKVKLMCADDGIEGIYTKSGMIAISDLRFGITTTSYYQLNDKRRLKIVAGTSVGDGTFSYTDHYTIDSKEVSKSKFQSWLKQKTNGEKAKSCGKLYKNTAKNRKKYLQ